MPNYRVRKGKTFGAASQYKAGDVVELPADIGDAFADKLELIQSAEIKVKIVDEEIAGVSVIRKTPEYALNKALADPDIEKVSDVPVIRKPRKKKTE